MSEITTIMTVEMTLVQKIDSESVDRVVKDNYNEQIQRNVADILERQLKMSNVNVAKVQCFVRDTPESDFKAVNSHKN